MPIDLNLSDLERSNSRSLRFQSLISPRSLVWPFVTTVEPVLKDHPTGHKIWSLKKGGLWRQVPLY